MRFANLFVYVALVGKIAILNVAQSVGFPVTVAGRGDNYGKNKRIFGEKENI